MLIASSDLHVRQHLLTHIVKKIKQCYQRLQKASPSVRRDCTPPLSLRQDYDRDAR